MKYVFLPIVISLFFPGEPVSLEKPRLVWSDEFNYEGMPDTTQWTYDQGNGCPNLCGWGNNELQYYTSAARNVRVQDGKLIIEVHREDRAESKYTSARIKSFNGGSWKYGYMEISARLPQGRGTWPAIWMLPDNLTYGAWPRSGEIDIMEHVGYDQGVVHGTVHTNAYNHLKNTQVGKQRTVENVHDAFHTYGINWTETEIEFYIDGVKYHEFKKNGDSSNVWPFDHHFHLILNIAVGGGWGGQQGVDESIWPQRMEVDYVRVYEPLTSALDKSNAGVE